MLPQGIPLRSYTDWLYGKTTESSKTQKLAIKAYDYRIYFYEGDAVDSAGVKYSVASLFVLDGTSTTSRYRYNGKTKKEIATDIADNMIAEISTLLDGTGISFTINHYTGTDTTKEDAYYTTTVDIKNTNSDGTVTVDPSNWVYATKNSQFIVGTDSTQYSRIVLCNKDATGIGGFYSSPFKDRIGVYGGFQHYKENYSYMRSGIRHEINQHALGLGHKDRMSDYPENSRLSKTHNMGNNNIAYMPLQRGFIHSGETTEDAVSGLFVVYNKSTTLKITGQLKNNEVNKQWFWDGYGTAYIVDLVKKECVYQSPIDQDGYFEFRIAVLPPSSVNHSILICSAEFLYWYIHSKKENDGTYSYVKLPAKRTVTANNSAYNKLEYKFNVESPSDGEIRYYYKAIGALDADVGTPGVMSVGTSIDAYGEGKGSLVLAEIYRETGFHMEYSGFATPAVTDKRQSMGSIVKKNSKRWECILTHKSTNWTMPDGSSSVWDRVWQVTSEAANAGDWKIDTQYKSKYRDEEESGSVIHQTGNRKYRCKVK